MIRFDEIRFYIHHILMIETGLYSHLVSTFVMPFASVVALNSLYSSSPSEFTLLHSHFFP